MWHRGCLKDSGYFGLGSGGSISVIILKISWTKAANPFRNGTKSWRQREMPFKIICLAN